MISSLVLSLREGLEAALVIGIVLGALKRTGRTDLKNYLWAGVLAASALSLFTALLLRFVDSELEGAAEQVFEGTTLLLAAGVLTWMIIWMRQQSRGMKRQLETRVDQATRSGGKHALFLLAFLAVLREGLELALYLTASTMATTGLQTLVGATTGLLMAAILGYLLFSATVRLNLQRFFQVTSLILILFAAGLVAQGVAEFNEAGIIPAIISPIWNLNPVLSDQSVLGMVFGTLFGYHGAPSLTEALSYAVYILAAFIILSWPQAIRSSSS
jgi:high-affinity iron transporter